MAGHFKEELEPLLVGRSGKSIFAYNERILQKCKKRRSLVCVNLPKRWDSRSPDFAFPCMSL